MKWYGTFEWHPRDLPPVTHFARHSNMTGAGTLRFLSALGCRSNVPAQAYSLGQLVIETLFLVWMFITRHIGYEMIRHIRVTPAGPPCGSAFCLWQSATGTGPLRFLSAFGCHSNVPFRTYPIRQLYNWNYQPSSYRIWNGTAYSSDTRRTSLRECFCPVTVIWLGQAHCISCWPSGVARMLPVRHTLYGNLFSGSVACLHVHSFRNNALFIFTNI